MHRAAWERMLEAVRGGLGEEGFAAAHDRLAARPPPDIIAAVMGDGTGAASLEGSRAGRHDRE